MRIGMIAGEYAPARGGVGAYTRILSQTLAKQGHELFILGTPDAREGDDRFHLEAIRSWSFGCWRQVNAWAQRNALDIVNLQYQTAAFKMSPYIHFIPQNVSAAPVITTFHDLRVPYLFPKAGALREKIVWHLAKTSDGVIVTNQEDEAQVASLPCHQLIPIGSNIEAPHVDAQSIADWRRRLQHNNEQLIGYFGLINASKGLDVLVDALKMLLDTGKNVRLIIVGDAGSSDPTNAQVQQSVNERIISCGISNQVTWTGYLPDEQVAAVLNAVEVMALPFRDGASYRRGSLMAALQQGCAIVTTQPKVPIQTFVDHENMRLVPPEDAAALASALSEVMQNSALRERLKQGTAGLARHFEWPTIAHSTAQFFEHTIALCKF